MIWLSTTARITQIPIGQWTLHRARGAGRLAHAQRECLHSSLPPSSEPDSPLAAAAAPRQWDSKPGAADTTRDGLSEHFPPLHRRTRPTRGCPLTGGGRVSTHRQVGPSFVETRRPGRGMDAAFPATFTGQRRGPLACTSSSRGLRRFLCAWLLTSISKETTAIVGNTNLHSKFERSVANRYRRPNGCKLTKG